MDYPSSVEGVGLVDGKFADENTATGQVGSLIPASWGNAVTDEIINVIEAAGLEPDENSVNQLVQAIQQLADSGSPTGMIAFIHATDVPDRWLLCNGAAVSRTTYANLFAKIGVTYGSGDGSTTFNLPNLDGRVLQGTTSTSKVGQYLEAQLPNITGSVIDVMTNGAIDSKGAFAIPTSWSAGKSSSSSADTKAMNLNFSASSSSSIYNGVKNQIPALQALACIRC